MKMRENSLKSNNMSTVNSYNLTLKHLELTQLDDVHDD